MRNKNIHHLTKMLDRTTFQKLLTLMQDVEAIASLLHECLEKTTEEQPAEWELADLVRVATKAYFKLEGSVHTYLISRVVSQNRKEPENVLLWDISFSKMWTQIN